MISRLPWWLWPWTLVPELRRANERLAEQAAKSKRNASMLSDELRGTRAQRDDLTRRNRELNRQVNILAGAGRGSGRATVGWEQAGGAVPEFVIVGIDRGAAGGKRLYASKELAGTSFGSAGLTANRQGSAFHLATAMGRMLVIDKPGYSEALNYLALVWRNQAMAELPPPPPRALMPAGDGCTYCGHRGHRHFDVVPTGATKLDNSMGCYDCPGQRCAPGAA